MSATIALKLFGACRLERDGQVMSGPTVQPRRLALLALLATAPQTSLSRERLLAYLWPEHPEEQGRHILNVTVHVLRREFGADAIESIGSSLHLNTSRIRPDTLEFDARLQEGELERAVALYRGPFLDGFFIDDAAEFTEWQDAERRRLATLAGNAVEGLAGAAESRGDLAAAVLWWERRFAADPAVGRVVLRLMRALENAGDRARALIVAQRHATLVRTEFGVEPHPDIVAETERIRSNPTRLVSTAIVADAPEADRSSESDRTATGTNAASGDGSPGHAPPGKRIRIAGRKWAAPLAGGGLLALTGFMVVRMMGAPPGIAGSDVVSGERRFGVRDSVAFGHYVRGRFLWNQRNEAALLDARAEFESAIAVDSGYAQAWSGLADTYLLLPSYGGAPASDGFARAWAAAQRGFDLDSTSAETRTSLAQAMTEYVRDRRSAERHFIAAIEADTAYPTARHWYALFLASERRTDEALAQIAAGRAVDPLSRIINAAVGAIHYLARDWPLAIQEYRNTLALQPDFARGHALLGRAQLGAGDGAAAIASLERAVAFSDQDPGYRLLLAHALAAVGRVQEAQSILRDLGVDNPAARDQRLPPGVEPFTLAAVWVALGESEAAFQLLERAVDEYDTGIEYLNADPRFDLLRDRPRFQRLLARLGF